MALAAVFHVAVGNLKDLGVLYGEDCALGRAFTVVGGSFP